MHVCGYVYVCAHIVILCKRMCTCINVIHYWCSVVHLSLACTVHAAVPSQ